MFTIFTIKKTFLLVWVLFILSACSGGAQSQMSEQPIASYPKNSPVAISPPPSDVTYVYESYIELLVNDVDQIAARTEKLTIEHNGYLSDSQSWFIDGRKIVTLVLAVPTYNYQSLHRSIVNMGQVVNESVSGELLMTGQPGEFLPFSHITLQLRPSSKIMLPRIDPTGWNPVNTFRRAFTVFLTIFGFLADIIIWIVVVGGPFLLMFILARIFLRKFQGKK